MVAHCWNICSACPQPQTAASSNYNHPLHRYDLPFRRKLYRASNHGRVVSCSKVGLQEIVEISQNKVLIAAGVSAAVGQLSKPFTSAVLYRRSFDFREAVQSGGFPSTHSAAVVATATSLALERGCSDSIFGLAVVYAALVMYDAQGVRREVGKHAKVINKVLPRRWANSDSTDSRDGELEAGKPAPGRTGQILSDETAGSLELGSKSNNVNTLMVTIPSGLGDEKGSQIVAEDMDVDLLKEKVGHTEAEVIAGALLGFFISLLVYAST